MTGHDPTERLQAAAKDAIRAARTMLDAAEELIDDRERTRELLADAGTFVADMVDALTDIVARRDSSSTPPADASPGNRLRRISLGGPDDEPENVDEPEKLDRSG